MVLKVQVDVVNLIKLLPVGPIRPLHVPIKLRGLGREDEERDLLGFAFLLELVLEL